MPTKKQPSSQQPAKKRSARDPYKAANDPFIPAAHAVVANETAGPINTPDDDSNAILPVALPLWRRIWRALRGGARVAR